MIAFTTAPLPDSWDFWVDATMFAAVFSFAAPIIWKVMSRLTDHVLLSLSLRTRETVFTLSAVENVPEAIERCKYILVRYGTDEYIGTLASDSEKYQGRLRNRIHAVKAVRHGSAAQLFLKLKVHKRLGTQFKLFVECRGDPEPVLDYLKQQDMVLDPELSAYSGVNRIYFLSKRFPIVKTVDGMRNNMAFPE